MHDGIGNPAIAIVLHSKEGVVQVYVYGGILFVISTLPLTKQMHEEVPEVLQPWYADDYADAGPAIHNARCLDFLCLKGPKYGYFLEPEKTWNICKGEDEAAAQAAHAAFDLEINFARGRRYLGGVLPATKEEYVKSKVDIWTGAVETLSKVAPKYPQSAYVGMTHILQK